MHTLTFKEICEFEFLYFLYKIELSYDHTLKSLFNDHFYYNFYYRSFPHHEA